MSNYPEEQSRVTGLHKDDTSGLMLLIQRIITEKQLATKLAQEKEQRIRAEKELELERQQRRRFGVPKVALPEEPPHTSRTIIGKSDAMKVVYYFIDRYSKFPKMSVHLYGETGVGKELVAQAIHELSLQANEAFIAVNCAELSSEDTAIVNGQIFGRSQGALGINDTGQRGFVEQANQGTLFLDEIHRLPSQTQGLLLRFLDTGVYRPLGGSKEVSADVQIISASEERLIKLADEGRFVPALIARLNAENPIEVPPLRERGEDILLIFQFFLKKYCEEYGLDLPGTPDELTKAVISNSWPRNVRALETFVKNMLIRGFADRGSIDIGCLDLLSEHGSEDANGQLGRCGERDWCPSGLDRGKAGTAEKYLDICEEIAFRQDKVTQADLAQKWNIKKSAVTQRINKLGKELRAVLEWPPNESRWPNARPFVMGWQAVKSAKNPE